MSSSDEKDRPQESEDQQPGATPRGGGDLSGKGESRLPEDREGGGKGAEESGAGSGSSGSE